MTGLRDEVLPVNSVFRFLHAQYDAVATVDTITLIRSAIHGLLAAAGADVAPDRVISTVDSEARHGHKTDRRGFDGYKGHIAIDPDLELVTATAVTAGNTGDAQPVAGLIADLIDPTGTDPVGDTAVVYATTRLPKTTAST